MKKYVDLLKNENAILDSYRIDLLNKKKSILNELKKLEDKKTDKKVVDETLKDLILEKIHKPDITFLIRLENELKNNKSIPLYKKDRIITYFRRYGLGEDYSTTITYVVEERTTTTTNTHEISSTNTTEPKEATSVSSKERLVSRFKRYSKQQEQPKEEVVVNAKEETVQPIINDKKVNLSELNRETVNNTQTIINNYHYQTNVNHNQAQNYLQELNQPELVENQGVEYPVTYEELNREQPKQEETKYIFAESTDSLMSVYSRMKKR